MERWESEDAEISFVEDGGDVMVPEETMTDFGLVPPDSTNC